MTVYSQNGKILSLSLLYSTHEKGKTVRIIRNFCKIMVIKNTLSLSRPCTVRFIVVPRQWIIDVKDKKKGGGRQG